MHVHEVTSSLHFIYCCCLFLCYLHSRRLNKDIYLSMTFHWFTNEGSTQWVLDWQLNSSWIPWTLENSFLHKIKQDGITSFTDFVMTWFWREKRLELIQIGSFRGKTRITNSTDYLRPYSLWCTRFCMYSEQISRISMT